MDSYLERLRRELEEVTRGVSADEMAQAPAGKWSGAQLLEHLLLTYKTTNRVLDKCLQKCAPLATRPTLRQRMSALVVINLGYMPGGRQSPERVAPRGMPREEVQQSLVPELEAMAAKLNDCEFRFGAGTKIMDHLFLGPLTAGEWRKFHWVHGRHHARQIRERIGRV
jgi:DinB family protein